MSKPVYGFSAQGYTKVLLTIQIFFEGVRHHPSVVEKICKVMVIRVIPLVDLQVGMGNGYRSPSVHKEADDSCQGT